MEDKYLWVKVISDPINLEVQTQALPTKGNLVYEYNPFRNYRLSENKYLYKNDYYSEQELKDLFSITISEDKKTWIGVSTTETNPILYEKGQLVDFITDELNFSLEHPVHIIPQYSYDGSVNLIINDGINIPRLINSRFSATGKNTYEIVDRKGNNDTNIYDQGDQFDIDTSLYKRVVKIPNIEFRGVSAGGNMPIGNYHFYFKLSDADGNETDFIGESGLVSIFIGFNDPHSIHTGMKNENSFKCVNFQLSNIDSAYDNVYVYYSRYTAERDENFVTQYRKVDKKFSVNNSGYCNIIITGFENVTELTSSDINLQYNVVDAAKTSATCQNMLFLGNVHRPNIPYNELADLSLRFLPYLKQEKYPLQIDQEYNIQSSEIGYYDPKFIYNKTGYWNKEIYRFGVVYILPNGELTPVFNIRGGDRIQEYHKENPQYSEIPIYSSNGDRIFINYNNENYSILQQNKKEEPYDISSNISLENVKGVVRFDARSDIDIIYGVDIRASEELVNELKKYVKGYFFVRQTRIPTILAQGITIGIDNEARTPCIPTVGGILKDIPNLDKTYVETRDIDDVNYITEGFLSRYSYTLKPKGGFFKILSSILSALAFVTSFIPGIGSIASLCVNAANFLVSSITTGTFKTAAFIATLANAVPLAGTAVGKIMSSAANKILSTSKITALTNTAMKLQKVSSTLTTIGNATPKIPSIIVKSANAIDTVTESVDAISTVVSQSKGVSYQGRNTTVPKGYKREENRESRVLNTNFNERIIIKDPSKVQIQGIICPDYEVDQAYYNQIFTGNKHIIRYSISQGVNNVNASTNYDSNYFSNKGRHFYHPAYYDSSITKSVIAKIVGVPDNTKAIGIEDILYRSRAGAAEEAWRYESVGTEYKEMSEKRENTDIVRGSFSAYLATNSNSLDPATVVDIMIPEYSESNINKYFEIRMQDSSVFNSISDRIDILNQDQYLVDANSNKLIPDRSLGFHYELYRGDCYLCQFTHRVIRNFNDPSAPYNDEIVDENSWKDNYDPENTEKYEQINLGDVNAVPLGMWVTFKLRSSKNLNIRTLDGSYVDEAAMTGHPRGFYPYNDFNIEGTYKHPDSQVYNKGFTKSLSERWNFELPDVPHIKNWFGTRIMYSDIHINDAYKNGYRVFQGTHYRDYTREYGEIVKLVPFESSLLCVFEHGIALIPVNERAVAGEGAGGNIYINTSNVLPENPKIISDMFGSQWAESVLKVPGKTGDSAQYVYGVDTVAKKIWRTDGNSITCISDFRVQEFLNKNITLGERELTPKIGIRNVKTVYNAFKRDVLFTFYDNTYGFEEKVWNLCWNELLQKFITFYSWVPSYMENINNIPFSFDRNTSKWIAKLGTSHTENSFADGITLSNVVVENFENESGEIVNDFQVTVPYVTKTGEWKTVNYIVASSCRTKYIGMLSLSNRVLPDSQVKYNITYSLERDQYGNYKNFEIAPLTCEGVLMEGQKVEGGIILPDDAMFPKTLVPLYYLKFKGGTEEYPAVLYRDGQGYSEVSDSYGDTIRTYSPIYSSQSLLSELYYRNKAGHSYADYDDNKVRVGDMVDGKVLEIKDIINYPIFKDITGKRPTLPREEMINPDRLVTLLNIKATIRIEDPANYNKLSDDYYNMKAGFQSGTSLVDAGYYESVVAITPRWNLQFLSTDFWKHGQAGLIDIADDIYPTYWYGRQHPFEFECVVVNDPSIHKIFTNLEIVANKAKPESFHYEIVGEAYDFAKDKVNMYFRQEAMKALWQYNGADICYDRNFLKVQPRQQPKSADLPHKYYTRQDTINEIEDYYIHVTYPDSHDYRHLSGAEIVYYPNRQEYRVWNHTMAVSLDDLSQDDSRSIIAANCKYLEDRWKVTINPILVCYKNEYQRKFSGSLIQPQNSTWTSSNRPKLPVMNSPIPDQAYHTIISNDGDVQIPKELTNLGYSGADIDTTDWLSDVDIYKYNFGEAQNRREVDIRDKFLKVRIRYSGEELAIIDFINTIYRISYA